MHGAEERRVVDTIGTRAQDDIFNFMEELSKGRFLQGKGDGKFFIIKYTREGNRENDFLEFIFDTIPIYALNASERSALEGRTYTLWKTASTRFVKQSKTGEFGELILFHLLELSENAVQVVNKMAIKDTPKMYVHGADAVHFSFEGGIKTLYIGEAKTEIEFNKAVKDGLDTISEYYNDEDKLKFEISLAAGNISEDIPKPYRDQIKKYLDPRTKDLEDLQHVHAIFIGYQFPKLKELEESNNGDLNKEAREACLAEAKRCLEIIEEKVNTYEKLKSKKFLFFVIPFKNLKKLREKFVEVINNGKTNSL